MKKWGKTTIANYQNNNYSQMSKVS